MLYKKIAFGFLGLLSLTITDAVVYADNQSWDLTIAGGAGFLQKSDNQTVSRGTFPADVYSPANQSSTGIVDVGLEKNFQGVGQWFSYSRLGLHYNTSIHQTTSGDIDEFGLADFDNYTYQYNIQRHTAFVTYGIDIIHSQHWAPYILLGIGASSNEASDYSETPKSGVTLPRTVNFADKTLWSLAYEAALGLRYQISSRWAGEVSYGYLNAGTVKLGESAAGVNGPDQALRYQTVMAGIRCTL